MAEATEETPPAKGKRPWWRTAIEIAVIVVIFFGVRAWQQRDAPSGPAPELVGTSLSGAPLALGVPPGEPVLVHFWATWCGVCRAEEGNIDGLAEDHRVITVAAQSGDASEVAAYMQEHDLEFDVINDPSATLAHQWGVHAFPASFVIAPDGTIRHVEVGYTTSLGLRARMWLARVL